MRSLWVVAPVAVGLALTPLPVRAYPILIQPPEPCRGCDAGSGVNVGLLAVAGMVLTTLGVTAGAATAGTLTTTLPTWSRWSAIASGAVLGGALGMIVFAIAAAPFLPDELVTGVKRHLNGDR